MVTQMRVNNGTMTQETSQGSPGACDPDPAEDAAEDGHEEVPAMAPK